MAVVMQLMAAYFRGILTAYQATISRNANMNISSRDIDPSILDGDDKEKRRFLRNIRQAAAEVFAGTASANIFEEKHVSKILDVVEGEQTNSPELLSDLLKIVSTIVTANRAVASEAARKRLEAIADKAQMANRSAVRREALTAMATVQWALDPK